MLFHSEYDAVLPDLLSRPVAHLPKQKWPFTTYKGEPRKMKDLEEKSVFSFTIESSATEITAVVARYSYPESDYASTGITCSFFMNPSGNADFGDFSQMHARSAGINWYERLTDFD